MLSAYRTPPADRVTILPRFGVSSLGIHAAAKISEILVDLHVVEIRITGKWNVLVRGEEATGPKM